MKEGMNHNILKYYKRSQENRNSAIINNSKQFG